MTDYSQAIDATVSPGAPLPPAANANLKLTGTAPISPDAAATALSDGPVAGVHPDVAMHMAPQVKAAADSQRAQDAVNSSPAVQHWVNTAGDAHVAATQDDLGSLATIAAHNAWQDFSTPIEQAFGQVGQDISTGSTAGAKNLLDLGAAALSVPGGVLNIGLAPLSRGLAGVSPGYTTPLNPFEAPRKLNPQENAADIARRIGLGLFALGPEAGEEAEGAAPIPSTTPHAGPDGRWSTTPEGFVADAKGQPVTFPAPKAAGVWAHTEGYATGTPQIFDIANAVEGDGYHVQEVGQSAQAALPAPGVSASVDATRGAVAEVDAASVADLQKTVADSKTLERSPSSMESFLGQQSDATVAMDPERLMELSAQGHEPFPELRQQITQAAEDGTDVTVPISRYLTATAGQPFADSLNAASTFREGGTSVDGAKEDGQSSATVPPASGELPGDLTAEETTRAQALAAAYHDQLTQVVKAQYLQPLVSEASALGLTKEQLGRYSTSIEAAVQTAADKMQARAYGQILRERRPDWREAAAQGAAQAEGELAKRPDIQAYSGLTRGKGALGEPLETPLKLDANDPLSLHAKDLGLPANMFSRGGLSPDEAAPGFGFNSGADMIRSLSALRGEMEAAGSKNIGDHIKTTARQMGEQHARQELGFDLTPESVHAAASELVNSPALTDFLTKELKDFAEAHVLPFNPGDMKGVAAARFAQRPVEFALNIRKYEKFIGKAWGKVEKALQKNRPIDAFIWRQKQILLQMELADAHKLTKQFARDQRLWGRVARNASLNNTAQDAVNWTKDILATMGQRVVGNVKDLTRPISGYHSLHDFISAKNNLGAEIINAPIPPLPPAKMTVDSYRGVSDMIRSILKTGRDELTIQRGEERQELQTAVDAGVESLNRYSRTIDEKERADPSVLQRIDAARRFVDAWLVRNEQLMRDFGARDFNSPFFQVVSRRLEARKAWANDTRVDMAHHFTEVSKDIGKGFDKWMKQRLPSEGLHTSVRTSEEDTIFNTNKDIAMAALHMGDEVALRKFAEGYNTNPATVETIVHSHATDQMWKMVEGVWGAFEKLRPEIEAMYYRLTDVHPTMVEPRSFDIPPGGPTSPRQIKGGYFPVIYDTAKMPKEWLEQQDPSSMLGDPHYVRATPSNSYIKSRTGASAPIRRDFNYIHARLNQVIHDLAYREALLDINKFLTHPDITRAIMRKYGPEYVGKIKRDLHAIAGAESIDINENAAVSRAVDWLTEGQMVNMIGFSPTTLMKHFPTAVGQAISEVGVGRLGAQYARMLTQGDVMSKEAAEQSGDIRHIISMAGEDSYQQFLALTERTGLSAAYRRWSFYAIAASNRLTAVPLFHAAKDMIRDQNPGMGEEDVQAAAGQIVRQALGSSGVTDAPMALRADRSVPGRFYRLQNNFLTFLSHMYNKSREIPQAAGYAGEDVDLGRALAVLLMSVVLPVYLEGKVSHIAGRGANALAFWALGLIHQTTAPVPGLNTAVAAGLSKATHGQYREDESPTASFGETVGANIADVEELLKTHELRDRMIRNAELTGGYVFKYPGLEASRMTGFFNQLREGKEQSKPLDQIINDLIYGPKESRAND